MKQISISVLTDTAGAGTGYGEAVVGALFAVQWVDGDLSDGVDGTLTCEEESVSIPLLVEANFNTDHLTYPRVNTVSNTDGTTVNGTTMPLMYGRPKLVLAAGGSAHTGGCVLYIVEM